MLSTQLSCLFHPDFPEMGVWQDMVLNFHDRRLDIMREDESDAPKDGKGEE